MQKDDILNDRYKIIKSIGNGGMSNVYLAFDLILKRYVCVKKLKLKSTNSPTTKKHFKREVQALTHLNSPYIVKIYDYNDINHVQYLVKEYVRGMNLKQYLQKYGSLSVKSAVKIMEQLLLATNEMHQHNIIHSDIKPQNILLEHNLTVKINDFGIADILYENSIDKINQISGTIKYLSPEQIMNEKPSAQSDIYSLGIVFYELLIGHPPFIGNSINKIANQHLKKAVPEIKLPSINKNIIHRLNQIILKATNKNLDIRYPNDLIFLDDVSHLDDNKQVQNIIRYDLRKMRSDDTHANLTDDDTKILNLNSLKRYNDYDYKYHQSNRHSKVNQYFLWLFVFILFMGMCLVTIIITKHYSVVVPNIKGKNKYEAIRIIHQHHLSISNIELKHDKKFSYNRVIGLSPSSHTNVRADSKVVLFLSDGNGSFQLKNYVGRLYSSVIQEIHLSGIESNISYQPSTFKNGTIIQQNLPEDMLIKPGQRKIHFVVSSGIRSYELKNLIGLNKLSVIKYAKKHNFKVRFKYQDSKQKYNTVLNQNPFAGIKEQEGDNIDITLSSNQLNKFK